MAHSDTNPVCGTFRLESVDVGRTCRASRFVVHDGEHAATARMVSARPHVTSHPRARSPTRGRLPPPVPCGRVRATPPFAGGVDRLPVTHPPCRLNFNSRQRAPPGCRPDRLPRPLPPRSRIEEKHVKLSQKLEAGHLDRLSTMWVTDSDHMRLKCSIGPDWALATEARFARFAVGPSPLEPQPGTLILVEHTPRIRHAPYPRRASILSRRWYGLQ